MRLRPLIHTFAHCSIGTAAAILCTANAPQALAAPADTTWHTTSVEGTDYYNLSLLRAFYKLSTPATAPKDGSCVISNPFFKLTLKEGAREAIIGGYKCMLTHPVRKATDGNLLVSRTDVVKLIDPVLRPTYIAERREVQTVVIDPGHGGPDEGNRTPRFYEAQYTLALAQDLAAELQKRGFKTVLTRRADMQTTDAERVATARAARHAIFISLHANGGHPSLHGIETYCAAPLTPGNKALEGNRHDEANAALAFTLHSHLVGSTAATDRACRRTGYSLLNTLNCPGAIVQVGFATNEEEAARLQDAAYRNNIIQGLANGIAAYKKAIAPGAAIADTVLPATPPPTPVAATKPAPPKNTQDKTSGNSSKKNNTANKSSRRRNSSRQPSRRRRNGRR